MNEYIYIYTDVDVERERERRITDWCRYFWEVGLIARETVDGVATGPAAERE